MNNCPIIWYRLGLIPNDQMFKLYKNFTKIINIERMTIIWHVTQKYLNVPLLQSPTINAIIQSSLLS